MLALLFPGQGSQVVGMGRDVAAGSPAARAVFEEADAVLGFPLSRICFEGPEAQLLATEIQQPAILTTSIALLRALEERSEIAPAFVLGHSLGEYSALVAADALAFGDAVALVHARGRFMQEAVPAGRGAMAAVLGADAETVEAACAAARAAGVEGAAVVQPANYNAPGQTVIAGDRAAVEAAGARARQAGARRVLPLPVSAPFHSPLMAPAAEKLAAELARVRLSNPRIAVICNVDAEPRGGGGSPCTAGELAALLERQVTAPVQFEAGVRRLVAEGVRRVLEVGPGRTLSGLVARIDRGLARANLASAGDLAAAADLAGRAGENR